MKRMFTVLLAACLPLLILAGCSGSKVDQMAGPQEGDTIATIKDQDFGEIKVRLFPDAAPKGVENFVGLAEQGYYDGTIFHRVIEDFMIQGGDPEGTGMGGESIWGEGFGVEYDGSLRHYNGALAYAHSSLPDSNGSQFYIVNAGDMGEDETDFDYLSSMMEQMYGTGVDFPEDVQKKYIEYGGVPYLDSMYTVFGQVYEGMDIVSQIMAVEKVEGSDGAISSPVEEVVIESITISTYEG